LSSLLPPPPPSTLFPYTTLFRSPAPERSLALRLPGRPRGRVAARHPDREGPREACAKKPDHPREPVSPRPEPGPGRPRRPPRSRSEEHTSELQSRSDLVCRLLLE